ncbi:MAG: prepilin peptidase [Candidatus Limnocylindrales bacterium]
MSEPLPAVFLLGAAGAAIGLLADRLAARWPAHPEGAVRAPDWRTVALLAGGIVAFAALPLRWSEPRDLAILAGWFTALLVLAATDLDQNLLPDLITLPLIPIVLLLVVTGWDPLLADKSQPLLSAALAGVGAPALLALSSTVLRGGLGMGDIKLAVSLGLMAGVLHLVGGFLVASIGGAAVLVVLLATRRIGLRSAVPFGPILIAGGICAAFVG